MQMKVIRHNIAGQDWHWSIVAVCLAALVFLPFYTVIGSFFTADSGAWAHLVDTLLAEYVFNSTFLMILTAVLAGTIGVGAAWLIAATDFPMRRILGRLLVLPIAVPAYIIAYFYADFLDYSGVFQGWLREVGLLPDGGGWGSVRNLPMAAFLLAITLYPYIYLLAKTSFERRAGDQFFAARSLGASATSAFWRIALPAARPAIAGGLVLVMMETLADFGVADHFALPTFSTGIFRSWLLMGDSVAALRLSGVLLVFVAVLVWLEAHLRKGGSAPARTNKVPIRMKLNTWQASLAILACLMPVVIGFGVPALGFVFMSLGTGDGFLREGFAGVAFNSLLIAFVVAAVALSLAVLLAYAERLSPSPIVKGAIRVSTLGYALPGALLAVGLLVPLGSGDRAVTRFLVDHFQWSGGLVLTGTIIALAFACVVRFLTVAFNSAQAGFSKIPKPLEEAARSLGEAPTGVVRRIHLPLLLPSLGAGGLLVMIDVLRELPATLILRPFGFETLATQVYRLAADERLDEAASACLALMLVGIVLVLVTPNRDDEPQR